MTQPDLFTSASPALESLLAKKTRCAKLARLFIENRGKWIDARKLSEVAGFCSWRTRCSEITREPWLLTIEQRNRRLESGAIVSERRLV